MSYQIKRLLADARGLKGWLTLLAITTFIISSVTSFMAAVAHEGAAAGTLSIRPPTQPLAFLRSVDPTASIQQNVGSFDDTQVLKSPGMTILVDYVSKSSDSFISLPLGALTSDPSKFSQMARTGRVLIGEPPDLRSGAILNGPGRLWGDLQDQYDSVSNDHIGPVALQQVSQSPPLLEYVSGDGYLTDASKEPLILISGDNAKLLGIFSPYRVSDLTGSFTCYCSSLDLTSLSQKMTAAEKAAGSQRIYYAVDYAGIIGPQERNGSVSALVNWFFAASTIFSLAVFVFMAARLLWLRCRRNYLVEWQAGSPRPAFLIRQEVLIFLAFTAPLGAGYFLSNAALGFVSSPEPLPTSFHWVAAAVLLLLQLFLTVQTQRFVKREFKVT